MSEEEIRALINGLSQQVVGLKSQLDSVEKRLEKEDGELWSNLGELRTTISVMSTMLAEIKARLFERCEIRGVTIEKYSNFITEHDKHLSVIDRRVDEIDQMQMNLADQLAQDRISFREQGESNNKILEEMQKTIHSLKMQMVFWSGGGVVFGAMLVIGAPRILQLVFG